MSALDRARQHGVGEVGAALVEQDDIALGVELVAHERRGNSKDPPPPGPPDRTTIGSGFGVGERAGRRSTKMWIVRPSDLLRSSGTVR